MGFLNEEQMHKIEDQIVNLRDIVKKFNLQVIELSKFGVEVEAELDRRSYATGIGVSVFKPPVLTCSER